MLEMIERFDHSIETELQHIPLSKIGISFTKLPKLHNFTQT